MAKQKPLADAVSDTLRGVKRSSWLDHVPASVRAEVEEIKRRFLAGEFLDGNGKPVRANGLATAIADNLKDRGISIVGRQGVLAWLKRNP